MHRISVSQACLCRRCPRLLAYQLQGHHKAWQVGLEGSAAFPGSVFHDQMAAPFHRAAASSSPTPLRGDLQKMLQQPDRDLEKRLLALLEEHLFVPAVKRTGPKLSGAQVLQLARGLELWNRFLADFLRKALEASPGEEEGLLPRLFHHPEKELQAVFQVAENLSVQVNGRYDALLFDRKAGEALVMEFKGRRAAQGDEDFYQLALYCALIRAMTGITPKGAIFYLEEDPPERPFDVQAISRALEDVPEILGRAVQVQEAAARRSEGLLPPPPEPELCRVCPFDPRCDEDWGVRFPPGEEASTDSAPPDEAPQEIQQYEEALLQALQALKLSVKPQGHIAGPRFIRFKVGPVMEQGVTVRKLMKQTENLQVALGLSSPPLIQPQPGHVSIDVPRTVRVPLTLGEVWRRGEASHPRSPVAFPLGMAIDGSIVWADLSDPTMTSVLVGGTAGSGKSVFLRSLAVSLALNATRDQVRITLVDPKRVSFTDLTELPHLSDPVVMDQEPALECLSELVEEMERRYRLFERAGVPDIGSYNEERAPGLWEESEAPPRQVRDKEGGPLSRQVVIIDEYADLIIDKRTRETLELFIQRLGQKGRAAGMHLILATQRPDAKVVTPIIKANLQLKVALKVTTATNSAVILDQGGAEFLIGHGDMLVGGSIPLQRLQGPLVTRTEIQQAMKTA